MFMARQPQLGNGSAQRRGQLGTPPMDVTSLQHELESLYFSSGLSPIKLENIAGAASK